HETQPMPGPTSRWFHHLAPLLHRIEVAANHVAQLAVPFSLFLPQPLAGVGALGVIVTQAYLIVSGNYAWLNWLTLLLAFAALPDSWFAALGWAAAPGAAVSAAWFDALTVALAAVVVWLSRHPVQPPRPPPADELRLQPAALGEHLRCLRQRDPPSPGADHRGPPG